MKKPNHVAIIMDGNGRWGLKHYGSRIIGHNFGSRNIEKIIRASINYGIKNLTLYSLSSDNLKKRSKKEINNILILFEKNINNNIEYFKENKIKLNIIGELNNLPKKITKIILHTNSQFNFKKSILNLNIAFNYSSRKEIITTFNKLKKLNKSFNIKNVDKYLYSFHSSDPEIIIRTGGKNRISDFLLWQSAYSEFFFIKKLWPDFKASNFKNIINRYIKIKRNFGK